MWGWPDAEEALRAHARAGSHQAASGRSGTAGPQVIGTLALGPRWEPLTCYSDRPWAISRDHGARNTRSSFGQQSLWCWSSWRSLYGAGGRDGSKVALVARVTRTEGTVSSA